jgi:hypothetical protein
MTFSKNFHVLRVGVAIPPCLGLREIPLGYKWSRHMDAAVINFFDGVFQWKLNGGSGSKSDISPSTKIHTAILPELIAFLPGLFFN